MSSTSVVPPFPLFGNTDGQPLDAGFIYVGVENLEPISNPISIYWDYDLTILASQPIRTLGGYPSIGGTPAIFYTNSSYSIVVKDKKSRIVFSSPSVSNDANKLRSDLANSSDISKGDALVAGKRSETGVVAFTQHQANQNRVPDLKTDFGAKGDGVWSGTPGLTDSTATGSDDTAAFIAALASGAQKVRIPFGTYLVAGGFLVPDFFEFEGDGMERTFIYHKPNASSPIMFQNVGTTVTGAVGVKFSGITFHGNGYRDVSHPPVNPTGNLANQCFNWNSGAGRNIPGLRLQDVKIVSFVGDMANSTANFIYGSIWSEFDNVHIVDNMWNAGLLLQSSDCVVKALYLSGNGGWNATPSLRVKGGADNRFIGCYFGGGGSINQVSIEGSIYNQFIGCTNDNTYGSCYRFSDAAGVNSYNNLILGGSATNADQSNTGTYGNIQFEDASSNNQVIGVKVGNNSIFSKYGVVEKPGSTCSNNLIANGWFDVAGKFTTAQVLLNATGGSKVIDCIGYRAFGFHGAAYTTATAQALVNGTPTIVNFDTKEYDTDSAVATGAAWKFTALSAGVYEISGTLGFTGTSSGITGIGLYKNGTLARNMVELGLGAGTTYDVPFKATVLLAAGDYIDVRAQIFSAMTLRTGATHNNIQITRVANS